MFINLISSNEKKKNLGNNASIHEDHRIFNNVQKWQTTPKSSLECEDSYLILPVSLPHTKIGDQRSSRAVWTREPRGPCRA